MEWEIRARLQKKQKKNSINSNKAEGELEKIVCEKLT